MNFHVGGGEGPLRAKGKQTIRNRFHFEFDHDSKQTVVIRGGFGSVDGVAGQEQHNICDEEL